MSGTDAVDGRPPSLVRAICSACLAALPISGVSVTLADGSIGETVHATDPVAAQVEELQFTLGEGPSRPPPRPPARVRCSPCRCRSETR